MTLTLALALGLTVGILLGLLGGGGSILAVPILVYALGFPLPEAIPTSLLVIGVASAVGVISKVRARLIEWRLAAIFAATGVLGTWPALPLASIYLKLRDDRLCDRHDPRGGTHAAQPRQSRNRLQDEQFRDQLAPMRTSVHTDRIRRRCPYRTVRRRRGLLDHPRIGSAAGNRDECRRRNLFGGHRRQLRRRTHRSGRRLGGNWPLTAAFAGSAIAGSLVAGRFGTRIATDSLRQWFAYLVFVVAGYVLIDTLVLG